MSFSLISCSTIYLTGLHIEKSYTILGLRVLAPQAYMYNPIETASHSFVWVLMAWLVIVLERVTTVLDPTGAPATGGPPI